VIEYIFFLISTLILDATIIVAWEVLLTLKILPQSVPEQLVNGNGILEILPSQNCKTHGIFIKDLVNTRLLSLYQMCTGHRIL